MQRLKPLTNQIFVVAKKQKKESSGGIALQSTETLDTPVGIVVEVGEGVTDVEFGNSVYIDWAKGRRCVSEDYEGVMIEDKYVLAILDE